MVLAAAAIAVLLMAMVLVYHFGEVIVLKIQLANAIDAGAQAAGASMATCLNMITLLNWARVIYRFSPAYPFISMVQIMLDWVAPTWATTVAIETAMVNGADLAVPLNFLGGAALPDLEVEEWKRWIFKLPIMEDVQQRTNHLPYGKRFFILGGIKQRPAASFLNPLRTKQDDGGMLFAISESAVHGSGLVKPDFHASLVKFHAGGIGMGVDWLKQKAGKLKKKDENSGNPGQTPAPMPVPAPGKKPGSDPKESPEKAPETRPIPLPLPDREVEEFPVWLPEAA